MINLKNRKILITGAHGFLGKNIVEQLLSIGCGRENLYTPTHEEKDLTILTNCKDVVRGIDIVIHAAGEVGGIGYNQKNPGELFYHNLIMGVQLMDEARKAGVEKFVAIGTICAYPKFTPVPFKEEDLWNGYPEETNAPYGLAKKMLLVQAQAYRQQYGFNAIYLLPTNLYGPGDNFNPNTSHVIPALIKKTLEAKLNKDVLEVWGTGKASREFLYVKDAAEAIVQATQEYNKSEPINIGCGEEITIKKLVDLVTQIIEFTGLVKWDGTKPDGQPRRKLDTKKARKEFGFVAKTPFEKGLRVEIDWYKQRYLK